MAVTEMELSEALKRASNLMSPEGQRRIEASRNANKNNFTADGGYVQPAASQGMRGTRPQSMGAPAVNAGVKLPRAIAESMSKTQIDVPASEYNVGTSVLDSIGYTPDPAPQRQSINEAFVFEQQVTAPQQPIYYQPAPSFQAQPMMIDYNYIRSIVNECIKANMQQIKEELLNESALKMVRLSGGNKIQLVDNKNNLYESQLEFKKNISKK